MYTIYSIQEYHQWLKSFDQEYRKKGKGYLSAQSYRPTLQRLKELGSVKCVYKAPRPLEVKRESFNTKGQRKKYSNYGRCFVCYQKAYLVRHHIIWLSNGGGNEKSNIVTLCESCHAEIHPWLKSKLKQREEQQASVAIPSTPMFDKLFM